MVFEKNERGVSGRGELERVPETEERSVEGVQRGTSACMELVLGDRRYEELSLEEKQGVRAHLLRDLEKAAGSANRVRIVARIFDVFGLKTLAEAFPVLGDVIMSFVNLLYLSLEARHAGLSAKEKAALVRQEVVDFMIGVLPIPLVTDIADYFYKSNVKALAFFDQRVEQLMKEAREKGVNSDKLKELEEARKKVERALKVGGWFVRKK
jgi:hypothetical protein